MRLHIFKFTCGNCGCDFKSPKMSFDTYGEFLLRNNEGDLAYLDGISDPVYQEVEDLLKQLPALQNKSAVVLAEFLRKVFGVACDPDAKGNLFSIGGDPVCPSCGERNASYWEATEPPEYLEIELPAVTHKKWFRLSEPEKLSLLANELNLGFKS